MITKDLKGKKGLCTSDLSRGHDSRNRLMCVAGLESPAFHTCFLGEEKQKELFNPLF